MKRSNRSQYFDEAGLKAFAAHLRKLRKAKGLSQDEVGFKAEISESQMVRIESAQINPTLSTCFKIARALDVEVQELFAFKLPKSPK